MTVLVKYKHILCHMDDPPCMEGCHMTSITTQVKTCWFAREETDYLTKEIAAFNDIYIRAK